MAKLEEMGWSPAAKGTQDRRVREATMTPEGRLVVERITRTRRRAFAAALAGWSDDERRQLPRLIRKLVGDLKALDAESL